MNDKLKKKARIAEKKATKKEIQNVAITLASYGVNPTIILSNLIILMKNNGYKWCEQCQEWNEIENHNHFNADY